MADLPLSVLASSPSQTDRSCGPPGKPAKPHSRMGRWRAGVLLALHAAFAVRIGFWLADGRDDGIRTTVTPVEPSESMFTLEQGAVNAGFIFFALALLSTLIFGRFFCGWACHVVALQDLCGWAMKKLGVHPRPFRSRVLLWAPLLLALYMFVWPTFRREALVPLFGTDIDGDGTKHSLITGLRESQFKKDLNGDGRVASRGDPTDFVPGVPESAVGRDLNGNGSTADVLSEYAELPLWLGRSVPLPGFTPHFVTNDFWATFAHWTIAVPFLIVCGFVTVYFLGAKAYCTYGCPYGGFFAPLDRWSPFRIRVSDDCNQCGHCTAVCTSNVRVHEEVRDFGAVIDAGCMKCLDCVNVCPNDALRVGVGLPAAFTKPINPDSPALASARQKAVKRYDLSLREEVAIALLFFAMFYGYRGMYNSVPLLMAMGVAMIAAFAGHKLWRLTTDRNVRAPHVQLKLDGRLRPAGYAFALLTSATLLVGVQGIFIKVYSKSGEANAARLSRTDDAHAAAGRRYIPTPKDREDARHALDDIQRAGSFAEGGLAFFTTSAQLERRSYLHAYLDDNAKAEADLLRLMHKEPPTPSWMNGLMGFYRVRQAPPAEALATLADLQTRWPENDVVAAQRATLLLNTGNPDQAIALYKERLTAYPKDIDTISTAASLQLMLNNQQEAMAIVRQGLTHRPNAPLLNERLAQAMFLSAPDRKVQLEAVEIMRSATLRQPTAQRWGILSQLYTELQLPQQAEDARRNAQALMPGGGGLTDSSENTPVVDPGTR